MPALPLWTALPRDLFQFLERMTDTTQYPVVDQGKSRCTAVLLADGAPDPHDWQLWRTGTFVATYDQRIERWPVYLRMCAACRSVEVRKEGMRGTVSSAIQPVRRGMTKRTPGAADVLLGWYQG
jgi:hypothetical protein